MVKFQSSQTRTCHAPSSKISVATDLLKNQVQNLNSVLQFFHCNLPCLSIWTKTKTFGEWAFLSHALHCGTHYHMMFVTHYPHLLPRQPWKVPTGSPLCDGDVAVYVFHINQRSLPTPFLFFYSVLLFLSLWLFQLYFIPSILPTTLRFLALFLWSYICLTGPFNYISLYESLLQLWYNPPQWGAADAEIKVPSGENTELKRSSFQAWSRSVYSHTCYAYCQGVLPCLFLPFQSIHLHFFQNLSQFFLCWPAE